MAAIIRTILIILLIVSFSQCKKVKPPDVNFYNIKFVTAEGTQCQGYISSNGGTSIIERGFIWKTEEESDYQNKKIAFDNKTSLFETTIFGLKPATTYYLKAYATNSEGTSFSGERTIITSRTGTFTDSRDGRTYKWVEIKDQIWMAENLSYMPYISTVLNDSGIFVYNYKGTSPDEAKGTYEFKTYGCLYEVKVSNYVCPTGWHLPSEEEWESLEIYLGMTQSEASSFGTRGTNQADFLKEAGTAHWLIPNNFVNNCSGFSVLPAGLYTGPDNQMVTFSSFGGLGSATEFLSNRSLYDTYYSRYLTNDSHSIYKDFAYFGGPYSRRAYSIRCIKD